jgi:hypothetical protein
MNPVQEQFSLNRAALKSNFLSVLALVLLCLAAGCGKKEGKLPTVTFTPLAKQTPVPLGVSTVDQFVEWVATMPVSQVDDVKAQIAAVRSDPNVVDAVAAGLSFRNPGSYGRQLIYLSILGEMQNERALGPLQSYLNSRDCLVFEERAAVHPAPNAPNTSMFDGCAGLKARAVSMIAHLNSEAATAVVSNAIKEHPSRTVRLAAIDAYLYNNADSPEAIATAKRWAKPDEVKFVGLPRLASDTNRQDFEARLTRFYTEHPEELPPQLVRATKTEKARSHGHPPRTSVNPTVRPPGGK